MIRAPSAGLKQRWGQTLSHVGVLAVALAVPVVAVWAGLALRAGATQWLEAYRPAVYLRSGEDAVRVHALRDEVAGWSGVDTVRVRKPADVMDGLRRRLGEDSVDRLAVNRSMLPWELIVHTDGVAAGDVEVVSRLTALETRPAVVDVVVPEARTASWIRWAGWAVWGGALGLIVGGLLGVAVLLGYLRRLHAAERRDMQLLEIFGAPPGQLRRASVLRGAMLGGAAGVAGTGACVLVMFWARSTLAGVFGGTVAVPAALWSLAAVPFAAGLLIGLSAGWWVGRRGGDVSGTREPAGLESVLTYDTW